MITVNWIYNGDKDDKRTDNYDTLEDFEWWFNNCPHDAAAITHIESDDSDENEELEWYRTKSGLNDTPTL